MCTWLHKKLKFVIHLASLVIWTLLWPGLLNGLFWKFWNSFFWWSALLNELFESSEKLFFAGAGPVAYLSRYLRRVHYKCPVNIIQCRPVSVKLLKDKPSETRGNQAACKQSNADITENILKVDPCTVVDYSEPICHHLPSFSIHAKIFYM